MELTVYKASAGSGKTYTLTREYLKQALRYPNNSYLFRSILAVTFTNKATEEMKNRIITTLNDLAQGNNDGLSNELQTELKIDAVELQFRAQKVRSAILHDYTHFSVSTIDTFFQKILHAFVREAGLRPGFNLELDTNRLLEEAVDKMLQNASKDKALRKWLFTLIENRIEDRSSWDMRPVLLALGKEVFSEHFRRFGNDFHTKTSDKAFMEKYAQKLNDITSGFERTLQTIGKQALKKIKSSGLEISDFKFGTSGFANFFVKISKGVFEEPAKRVLDALESIDGWISKTSKRRAEVEGIYTELLPLLIEAVEYWQSHIIQYNTACEIARKFRELGVLADIDKHIKDIAGEENLMPISDSVHLLSTLINDSDTPFVYERTGNRYKTFMIDEFQDTSVTQWTNFRPLLHNSLSENQFSMVVGDVKQSIYRWRNGDWRILAYQLGRDFAMFGLNQQNLNTNWRSKTTVIEFNNTLFHRLSAHLQLMFNNAMSENISGILPDDKTFLENIIPTAYTDTEQKPSSKTKADEGYVCIDVIDCDDEKSSSDKVLEQLPLLITELQDRGYNPNDIAVLTRYKKEGQQVADCLLQYKKASGDTMHCFDVISQDSLFIANSIAVQIVIAAMRMTINPNDLINAAFLRYQLMLRNNNSEAHKAFIGHLTNDEQEFIQQLANLSLNQAFELLVQHYKLNDNIEELPFLQELHDLISTFTNRKLSDISSFLQWWDDKGHTTTLSPGENQRAINIMTIHKSKGLQFPVVIIPFTNWSLEPKLGTTIWVSPAEQPFNELPYVPVVYGKGLQNTNFNTEYLAEKVQSYIDNINLMYVAFTRAENELYISIPKSRRENKSLISSVLPEFLKQYTGVNSSFDFGSIKGNCINTEIQRIEFGTKQNYTSAKNVAQGILLNNYPSTVYQQKLRLHYDSEEYFNTDPTTPMQRRNYGIFMHRIFAEISTIDECDIAINRLFDEGLIDSEGRQVLTEKVNKALQHPIARQWFDGSWDVKAETGLLLPFDKDTPLTQRPDRVMFRNNETLVIDYKFGLIEEKRYSKQLANYTNLLKQMAYPNVKAYIWYVDLEKVVEVV